MRILFRLWVRKCQGQRAWKINNWCFFRIAKICWEEGGQLSQNLSPFNQTFAQLKRIRENIAPETVISIYKIEVTCQLNAVKLWG